MRILLDTNQILFVAKEPERLTENSKKILSSVGTELWISTISLWEIKLKTEATYQTGKSRPPLTQPINQMIAYFLRKGMQILALEAAHITASLSVALLHKNPFDNLLILQTQVCGLKLLTSDKKLAGHPFVIIA